MTYNIGRYQFNFERYKKVLVNRGNMIINHLNTSCLDFVRKVLRTIEYCGTQLRTLLTRKTTIIITITT